MIDNGRKVFVGASLSLSRAVRAIDDLITEVEENRNIPVSATDLKTLRRLGDDVHRAMEKVDSISQKMERKYVLYLRSVQ